MRVIIVGASGTIGQAVTQALSSGHEEEPAQPVAGSYVVWSLVLSPTGKIARENTSFISASNQSSAFSLNTAAVESVATIVKRALA